MSNCKTIAICNQKGGVGKDDHYGKPRRRSCNAGKESAAHRRRPTGRLNHLSRLAGYRQLGYHACNETHRCLKRNDE